MSDCTTSCPLHDRPVDTERRRFLSAALAASVLGVLTACGDGNIGGLDDDPPAGGGGGGGGGAPLTITVANFVPLRTDGGIARVDAGSGTPIAVVRVSASSYRAFSLVCPHAGTTVNVEANGFRCPNHGATFAANGNVTGGPAPTGLTELTATYNATAGTLTIG